MLIIFLRAVILFVILLFVFRLMGKRQIGEMEPFELVITLVIAELACIPMADRSIPLTYGIVAILTMFVIHQVIVLLSSNSTMQAVLSGKPVMVLDTKGINSYALKQMNMQVNDLLQALRSAGYFSIEQVKYGLMETNGQLSVIANVNHPPEEGGLPIPIVLDGKFDQDNIDRHSIDKERVLQLLSRNKVRLSRTLLLTCDETNHVLIQPTNRPYFTFELTDAKLVRH